MFNSTKIGFAAKSNIQLLKGYLIFSAFRPILVNNSEQILQSCQKLFGTKFINFVTKKTLFELFCAGENETETLQTLKKLSEFKIGGIINYSAEADKDDVKTKNVEDICDINLDLFAKGIEVASKSESKLSAIKMTALGDVNMIEKLAVCCETLQNLFPERKVMNKEEFQQFQNQHFVSDFPNELFNGKNQIDKLDWFYYLDVENSIKLYQKLKSHNFVKTWDVIEDGLKIKNLLLRLTNILNKAQKLEVKILVDAEQTYFQPAIDMITLQFMKNYNKSYPIVYQTYQAYLKDSSTRLDFALNKSQKENWIFACKVVRGAYIIKETSLARELNKQSPIHETIDKTAESYHRCCRMILERDGKLIAATHNRDSVLKVIDIMKELNKPKESVTFAQLYGMCDMLTFGLAAHGYSVIKNLPYGPIDRVIPYLIRRAQENASITDRSKFEKNGMKQEIKRRLFGS